MLRTCLSAKTGPAYRPPVLNKLLHVLPQFVSSLILNGVCFLATSESMSPVRRLIYRTAGFKSVELPYERFAAYREDGVPSACRQQLLADLTKAGALDADAAAGGLREASP